MHPLDTLRLRRHFGCSPCLSPCRCSHISAFCREKIIWGDPLEEGFEAEVRVSFNVDDATETGQNVIREIGKHMAGSLPSFVFLHIKIRHSMDGVLGCESNHTCLPRAEGAHTYTILCESPPQELHWKSGMWNGQIYGNLGACYGPIHLWHY